MSTPDISWPDNIYFMPQQEKEAWILSQLNMLNLHHVKHCSGYANIVNNFFGKNSLEAESLECLPFLTVSLFKLQSLASIPKAEYFKTLSSSGTSGIASSVVLDRETAKRQPRALTAIMKHWLGSARRPMIIIDSCESLHDRANLSARATATAGFSMFGADHFYALDENMQSDDNGLHNFLSEHAGQPLFIFGFTFMVWQWLQQSGGHNDLSNAFLLHGGGWKKLQDQAVSSEVFKHSLQERFNINAVHNYYGMVEQVGSISVACENGYLHPPVFADVLVRDPQTLEVLPLGSVGALQLLSLIPTSYPGHSLLSEDEAIIHGVDDCACGRKGKYFSVFGRLAKAELRGCSDTREMEV